MSVVVGGLTTWLRLIFDHNFFGLLRSDGTRCPPSLLHTYSAERRTIAKELIDFDREWAALLASTHGDSAGPDPAKTQSYFVKSGRYTAGTATHYGPSLLTGEPTYQHLVISCAIFSPRIMVSRLRTSFATSFGLCAPANANRRRRSAAALPVLILISNPARRSALRASRFFAFSVFFDVTIALAPSRQQY